MAQRGESAAAERRDFDVVVVGAGLVGSSAALALAREGLSVALLDRRAPEAVRGALGFDARTVALNHLSARLLERCGVWDGLPVTPYQHVVVWEDTGTAEITFHAADVALEALGWIAEASPLAVALWHAAEAAPRIECLTGELSTLGFEAGRARVQLSQAAVRGRLLVAADGSESTVRRLLGVGARHYATPHDALATVIETERPHGDTAYQRFLHNGPVALLPLPSRNGSHYCSVVWSQSRAEAERRMGLDDAAFADELARATECRLGAVRHVDRRFRFGLRQQIAEDLQPAPGVLVIGDAARVLHPLAGQGVNLGFEDVQALTGIASRVAANDLAQPDLWRGFGRRRRLRAEVMVRAMDAFRRIYAADAPLPQWLRNVGVDAVNRFGPLKSQLIKEALGTGILTRTL